MSDRKATQAATIETALLSGNRVDTVMAFGLGITRLSAVIKRLRDGGLPILTERDHNNGIARYRLPDDYPRGQHG